MDAIKSSTTWLGDTHLITAKDFAAQGTVWHRATPTLEQYTRWVNKNTLSIGYPVSQISSPNRRSLIAETAFEAVRRNAYPDAEVQSLARQQLRDLPDAAERSRDLDGEELVEAQNMQDLLGKYLRWHATNQGAIRFRPEFDGCGVVQRAQGDIATDRQLIEVKAVQRNVRSIDFRQALTYAAMAHSKGQTFDSICILNPRQGRYFRSSAEGLALDIGAGSWIELMQDLINQMSDDLTVSH